MVLLSVSSQSLSAQWRLLISGRFSYRCCYRKYVVSDHCHRTTVVSSCRRTVWSSSCVRCVLNETSRVLNSRRIIQPVSTSLLQEEEEGRPQPFYSYRVNHKPRLTYAMQHTNGLFCTLTPRPRNQKLSPLGGYGPCPRDDEPPPPLSCSFQ